ncbi:MAG: hypothetical protein ABI728_05845, partial [Betaproteobacteria bacterium]
ENRTRYSRRLVGPRNLLLEPILAFGLSPAVALVWVGVELHGVTQQAADTFVLPRPARDAVNRFA